MFRKIVFIIVMYSLAYHVCNINRVECVMLLGMQSYDWKLVGYFFLRKNVKI